MALFRDLSVINRHVQRNPIRTYGQIVCLSNVFEAEISWQCLCVQQCVHAENSYKTNKRIVCSTVKPTRTQVKTINNTNSSEFLI